MLDNPDDDTIATLDAMLATSDGARCYTAIETIITNADLKIGDYGVIASDLLAWMLMSMPEDRREVVAKAVIAGAFIIVEQANKAAGEEDQTDEPAPV